MSVFSTLFFRIGRSSAIKFVLNMVEQLPENTEKKHEEVYVKEAAICPRLDTGTSDIQI